MYEVKGKIYRGSSNNTVISIAQEFPYTHFERVLSGNWEDNTNDEIVSEVLRIVYMELDPSNAIQKIDNHQRESEVAIDNLSRVVKDAEELVAEIGEKTKALDTKADTLREKTEEIDIRITQLDGLVNSVAKQFILSTELSEEQKESILSQYKVVGVGDTVFPNEIVNIGGELFRMVQGNPITIHAENWLEDASLFAPFLQRKVVVEDEGAGEEIVVDVVDEFKQPQGGHDAYKTGDKVMFDGEVWESTMDGNVWSPAGYPAGWKKA